MGEILMGKEVWRLKQWTGLRKTKVILRLSGKLCGRGLEGFLLWDAVSGDSFLSSSPQSFSITHIDIFPSTAGTPHSHSSVPWASPSHPIFSSVLFPQFPHFFHLLCLLKKASSPLRNLSFPVSATQPTTWLQTRRKWAISKCEVGTQSPTLLFQPLLSTVTFSQQ